MKVFISQPMHGRTEEEILKERAEVLEQFRIGVVDAKGGELKTVVHANQKNARNMRRIKKNEVIDNLHHPDVPKGAGRVWHLGRSISLMDKADFVIFVSPGCYKASGCVVEHEICKQYKIPYVEFEM